MCDLSQRRLEGRVYMHARTIHNVLAQGRHSTVQKSGSNHPNPPVNHTLSSSSSSSSSSGSSSGSSGSSSSSTIVVIEVIIILFIH